MKNDHLYKCFKGLITHALVIWFFFNRLLVCTDLSCKEQHRQVGIGSVITSDSLGGEMVSTLAWNARDVGLIPILGSIFPIFIIPTTLVAITTSYVLYGH